MDISKIIENINSQKYSPKELVNLYKNTINHKNVLEEDKENIISAIELVLREKSPTIAKKIFGAKDTKARDILFEIFTSLSNHFNFSENTLKNGVKTGGTMISGECHIDIYLSYKNSARQGASLALVQETIDGELMARIERYQTASKDYSRTIKYSLFDLSNKSIIENTYKEYLTEIIA